VIQLLTATGARPEAFALCQRWMARQTHSGPVLWIIVDDGPEPMPVTFSRPGWRLVVVRPSPFWQPGRNTQSRNILKGLELVDRKLPVLIIEDDDWYAPDWIERAAKHLEWAELVGEMQSRYYNVRTLQGRQLPNRSHASLCGTALRDRAVLTLQQVCQTKPKFIDLHLWRLHGSKRLFDGHRCVGIKGLPGRGGIGVGHKDTFTGTHDPDGTLLRSWIGDDAGFYLTGTPV